jgi:hypothetical protein
MHAAAGTLQKLRPLLQHSARHVQHGIEGAAAQAAPARQHLQALSITGSEPSAATRQFHQSSGMAIDTSGKQTQQDPEEQEYQQTGGVSSGTAPKGETMGPASFPGMSDYRGKPPEPLSSGESTRDVPSDPIEVAAGVVPTDVHRVPTEEQREAADRMQNSPRQTVAGKRPSEIDLEKE